MKEEQNASSSANYDVEIFHSSKAHSVILGSELQLPTSIKEGTKYETVSDFMHFFFFFYGQGKAGDFVPKRYIFWFIYIFFFQIQLIKIDGILKDNI